MNGIIIIITTYHGRSRIPLPPPEYTAREDGPNKWRYNSYDILHGGTRKQRDEITLSAKKKKKPSSNSLTFILWDSFP